MNESKKLYLKDVFGNEIILNFRYIISVRKNEKGYTNIVVEVPGNPSYVEYHVFNESVSEINRLLGQ